MADFAVAAAFAEFDVEVREPADLDSRPDAIVDPESAAVAIEVKRWSLVDEPVASRLATRSGADASPDVTTLVVADRITQVARTVLESHGLSYLDLRGHLHFWTPRLKIIADLDPLIETQRTSSRLAGAAGMEIACSILLDPERAISVRDLARQVNRSASTVSEILRGLRDDRLLTKDNQPEGSDLFWALADRWGSASRLHALATLPQSGDVQRVSKALALGLDDVEGAGWALTDDVAAALYGAPVAVSFYRPSFLLPDPATARRAVSVLGAAGVPAQARCVVRAAPVRFACEHRQDSDEYDEVWPLARPLFVALDLAQDPGRGREVLDAWNPGSPWWRVW